MIVGNMLVDFIDGLDMDMDFGWYSVFGEVWFSISSFINSGSNDVW